MKHITIAAVLVVSAFSAFSQINSSETEVSNEVLSTEESHSEMIYEVIALYPDRFVLKSTLDTANTISDIDRWYRSEWVKKYISVDVKATCNGIEKQVFSKNDTLNQAQKAMLKMADSGSEIVVDVKYMPDNTLKINEAQQIYYSFTVGPKKEAQFTNGDEKLSTYLKENAVDKITIPVALEMPWTEIHFTVDEDGNITEAQVIKTSADEAIDNILLNAICQMPKWTPAIHSNGSKVKQNFVFGFGKKPYCAYQ